ncbi:MAG TPA: DNA repair exonuclease [Nitrososphaerales archaeon]|nr:DNA repair exonuclease [Nitrososphaerales archaeon]
MHRFAHMSDLHIGAFRQQELKDLLLRAFESTIDRCISERVEFVIISGDIFDSNIPDLASVRRATLKLRQAVDEGIRFYVVYGSHDFSPNYASIVDVLESAGLFLVAEKRKTEDGRLRLSFLNDATGAKICGVSGKKLSLDIEDYRVLDRKALEEEDGFKVFVFHGAVQEMLPPALERMEGMSSSLLPSAFNYYAGGHVHGRQVQSLPGRKNIAYPGPIFATEYSELIPLARGEERGFYLVDFDDDVRNVQFVPIKVCEVVELQYRAEGKSSREASDDLLSLARNARVGGKVVLLTVDGVLGSGKTSDIDFGGIRRLLMASSPITVLSNFSRLTSVDLSRSVPHPKPAQVTEGVLFRERIAAVKSNVGRLRGEDGVALSLELLKAMKAERLENENKGEYQSRIEKEGLHALGLTGEEV